MNLKPVSITLILTMMVSGLTAQAPDTVVVELASSSKVVFTIGYPGDIDVLRNYDYQALFDDIFAKLQGEEVTPSVEPKTLDLTEPAPYVEEIEEPDVTMEPNASDYKAKPRYMGCCKRYRKTSHAFNFDIGINNVIGAGGRFPDVDNELYSVRPWGSWYVGINSVLRTDISRELYIETAIGVSWYNFKFQDETTLLLEDVDGVVFAEDQRSLDFQKSKLTMTFLNASLIPMIRLGGHHHHHQARFWNTGGGFRIGMGPYVGYRLESHTHQVYEIDGENYDDKEWNNFFLNNLRYGLRLQLGIGDTDFFVNYDLNELFAEDRGPQLNAFSFGVIF